MLARFLGKTGQLGAYEWMTWHACFCLNRACINYKHFLFFSATLTLQTSCVLSPYHPTLVHFRSLLPCADHLHRFSPPPAPAMPPACRVARTGSLSPPGKNGSGKNAEEMFEQWKLGFPIGSLPPAATAAAASASASAAPTPPTDNSSPSKSLPIIITSQSFSSSRCSSADFLFFF